MARVLLFPIAFQEHLQVENWGTPISTKTNIAKQLMTMKTPFNRNACPTTVLFGALLTATAPFAHASIISIDDVAEFLVLKIDQPDFPTNGGAPGAGTVIDINTPSPALGIHNIAYNATNEVLSFIFDDHSPWNDNVYLYRYFLEPAAEGGGYSDLFVIQGIANKSPDHVTFISNDLLTGNIAQDIATFGITPVTAATPFDLGQVPEVPGWQLVIDTGPDQYYMTSLPDGGTTVALLGLAMSGMALARRKLTRA